MQGVARRGEPANVNQVAECHSVGVAAVDTEHVAAELLVAHFFFSCSCFHCSAARHSSSGVFISLHAARVRWCITIN